MASYLRADWLALSLSLFVSPGYLLAAQSDDGLDCAGCHDVVELTSPIHGPFDCTDCHEGKDAVPHATVPQKAAGESLCEQCHDADPALAESVHSGFECGDCHGSAHDLSRPLDAGCGDCHVSVADDLNDSAHAGVAGCGDCHGPLHALTELANAASPMTAVNQIETCGRCHAEPPELVESFRTGVHAHGLLVSGLISAPGCAQCHGTHNIAAASNPDSMVAPERVPQTCGACHQLLLDKWVAESSHGQAWQNDEGGPVCTTCHKSHGVHEPTTGDTRLRFPETCGDCHGELYSSFRDSFHGKATDLGFLASAICSDCHTPHANLPADDPRSSVHPDNLLATCQTCHENATASFISFNPHSVPSDPTQQPQVFFVWLLMVGLLIAVFAFFGIHDLLWLQRTLVGTFRGEYDPGPKADSQYVRRFSGVQIGTHVVIIVSFLLLAATGLPLKFHSAAWAQGLINVFGGVEIARILHRLGALVTFGYFMFHLAQVFWRSVVEKERGLFWGPHSMVPQPKDMRDLWRNLKYFLYAGERPAGDRWTYWEKFDYLAVFWGVAIIGLSGLFLWFPAIVSHVLPGWALSAAYIVHSEEALLATGFIFIFHFIHTHLRPEAFPMDPVIFTGKMTLQRFKEERQDEYRRLVETGQLESILVDAPTRAHVVRAYLFGFASLFIGLALAVAIFWALLAH